MEDRNLCKPNLCARVVTTRYFLCTDGSARPWFDSLFVYLADPQPPRPTDPGILGSEGVLKE